MTSSLKFINSSKNCIKLILEPWAEEYKINGGKAVEVISDRLAESSIEVEFDESDITIYGWSDSMSVFCDGVKLEPEFGQYYYLCFLFYILIIYVGKKR